MRTSVFVFILLLAGRSIQAQAKPSVNATETNAQQSNAAARATMLTEKQTALLNLTAEQKSKIYSINLDKCQQVDMARMLNGNSDAFKVKRKKINEQRDVEINSVLTPEQKAVWKKAKEENKKKKGNRSDDVN